MLCCGVPTALETISKCNPFLQLFIISRDLQAGFVDLHFSLTHIMQCTPLIFFFYLS